MFAKRENGLSIDDSDAAAAVLEGYSEYLTSGGKPFVLEESHPDLRAMATGAERDPVKFWGKLVSLASAEPPKRIQRKLLNAWLPDGAAETLFYSRIAGVGSLGRPRYVGIAQCNGGLAAREAKAWLPSAWGWANGRPKDQALAVRLLKRSVRQCDPFYLVKDGWVVRRLGPHCGRIELSQFPKQRDEKAILKAMGAETANLHLATSDQCAKVLRDLGKRKPDWLVQAASAMASATEQDWKTFRSAGEGA
jgi:hypothetical protein